MGPVITVVLRAAFGLVVATGLAFVGFFAGWFSAPSGSNLPASYLIVGAGLGAAIGGLIGWFKPESPRFVKWSTLDWGRSFTPKDCTGPGDPYTTLLLIMWPYWAPASGPTFLR